MYKLIIPAVLLAGVAFGVINCSGFETIEPSARGIKVVMKKVEKEPLMPGYYFTNPFTTSVIEMNVQTQKLEKEALAYTKDVQQASLKYSINYNLNPANVVTMYQNVGADWEEKLIPPLTNALIKDEVGKYAATDLIAKRSAVTASITTILGEQLAQRGIIMTTFQLSDIQFDEAFEQAAENKVRAVQEAEKAENDTVRIREEANQYTIKSQAEADSQLSIAKAQAEAMKIKNDALSNNPKLIEMTLAERWNGALPQIMSGGNSLNVLDVTRAAAAMQAGK